MEPDPNGTRWHPRCLMRAQAAGQPATDIESINTIPFMKYKLLIATAAVGVIVSATAFTSNARTSRTDAARQSQLREQPKDVIQLRAEFEKQCVIYEKMIEPYHERLENLSEDKLTAGEARELLAEVDEATGEQERLLTQLRRKLSAKIQTLGGLRSAS